MQSHTRHRLLHRQTPPRAVPGLYSQWPVHMPWAICNSMGVCLTVSRCPLHSPCPRQGPVTVKHHGQQLKVDLVASHVAAAAGRLLAGEVGLVLGWSTAVHRARAAVFSTHMPCIPSGLLALHLLICTSVCKAGLETWALVYCKPCREMVARSFATAFAGPGAVSNQLDRS